MKGGCRAAVIEPPATLPSSEMTALRKKGFARHPPNERRICDRHVVDVPVCGRDHGPFPKQSTDRTTDQPALSCTNQSVTPYHIPRHSTDSPIAPPFSVTNTSFHHNHSYRVRGAQEQLCYRYYTNQHTQYTHTTIKLHRVPHAHLDDHGPLVVLGEHRDFLHWSEFLPLCQQVGLQLLTELLVDLVRSKEK